MTVLPGQRLCGLPAGGNYGLDDDRLDIPGYQPEYGWKPATGTGVAPDIRPTAVRRRKSRA